MITEEYRALNRQLHIARSDYGRGGDKWAPTVLALCNRFSTEDVLDYGCGKAMLADALPFPIQKYDPAIDGYSARPHPADVVVCTDVLEHVEPEQLQAVLTDLARLTKKIALLHIATEPAKKTLADGRNAHLIVQPSMWWLRRVAEYFDIVEFRASPLVMVVEPCRSTLIQT